MHVFRSVAQMFIYLFVYLFPYCPSIRTGLNANSAITNVLLVDHEVFILYATDMVSRVILALFQ